MTTRRNVLKGGAGLAAILASGKAQAALIKSMLAARNSFAKSRGNAEEEMYKELFLGLLNKTLTEVDIADEIDATYGHGAGARPFFGQSNITSLRLRNLKTDNYSSFYLDGLSGLRSLYLDASTWIAGSMVNLSNVSYVYMPSVTRIANPITSAPIGGVFDFGISRTCQELLDSWGTLFQGVTPNTRWTFRCSDGDVVWNATNSAWEKAVDASAQNGGGV